MNYPLPSERVVISAPMSFAGSAQRIWKITDGAEGATKVFVGTLAVFVILMVWCLVLTWYSFFGLLVVPYRLFRRSSRKNKQQSLRHREGLQAMNQLQIQQQMQTALLAQQQTAYLQAKYERDLAQWHADRAAEIQGQPAPRQLPPPAPR